ncbi:GTP-binding protein [uncultured Psychroserpens sp.]|uniref:GTP-binding protein n=1 Tax=uncultured Psychroserpens sp. TaxID=255436 RepID=UPI0026252D2C|nr:GTP-binding protein [uncultured Psychroserpens sp.]
MSTTNEIVLRPRFKFPLKEDHEMLLKLFEDTKTSQSDFIVSRIDDHVFIKIPKVKQHFWSPQLHLEINKNEAASGSIIYGLFGPNPTVWTMFMFFHFVVAGLFIGFGIWSYVNWSLGNDYAIQLFVTLLMIVIWFVLYFGGRLGKKTGMNQMHELHHFMRDTLRNKNIHAEV